ncbi:hypothetical protein LINPERPRIM_LOCUS31385 [Linum perenne]
MNLAEKL